MKKFLLLLLLLPISLTAQTIRPTFISQIQWTELTTAQEASMTLAEGSFWYNTTLNCYRYRSASSTYCVAGEEANPSLWNSVRVVDGTRYAKTDIGIQEAIDDANTAGDGLVFLPPGTYAASGEITIPITGTTRITGAGPRVTFIQVTSFGANQALFKFDDSAADTSLFTPKIENLTVLGNSNKSDPIAFDFRHPKNAHLRNVHTRSLGNISVFWTGTNNSRLDECTFLSSGRPLLLTHELTTTARFSITSAATTVTANEAVFSAADVGRHFIVDGAGPEGEPLNTSITVFTNSTTVTVADTASTTVSNVIGSFTGILGSITAAATTLTVDSDETIFDSADVGRLIFVLGASSNNRILVTTIASVTNATTVELTDAASATVTNVPVWLTPTVAFVTPEDESASPSRITNDLVLTDIQVENYNGIGYLFGPRGTNIFGHNIKSHGHNRSVTNFGQSGNNYVVSDVKWMSISGEVDFGYGSRLNEGHLLTVGLSPVVYWHDFDIAGTLPENFGLVRQESPNLNTFIFIGPGFAQTRIPTGTAGAVGPETDKVYGTGPIARRDTADGDLTFPLFVPGDLNHDGTNVGFFAVTPAARPGATDDIKDGLTTLGLLQGTSATPLNLDGGLLTAGGVVASAGVIEYTDAPTLAASTTPSVTGGNVFLTNSTASITDFTGEQNGQVIILLCGADTTTSLVDSTPLFLAGAFTCTADDTITLVSNGTVWFETSRSLN